MKGEVASEFRSLLLYLCMESLASKFEVGLAADFEGEELKDVNRLFWHLRKSVIENIRATAIGHRLAMEREGEDKNKKE